MAKLVILTQGMTDRAHELKADRTTIGRVEDNMFQIAESSVSSHHAEVLLRGNDVVIKDLDSTNGTFIDGEKITESVLKPGQTLRFGNVELRLDTGAPANANAAPASTRAPRQMDTTLGMTRGVSLGDLEKGGAGRPTGFDSSKDFSKKTDKVSKIFIGVLILAGLVIVALIFYALKLTGNHQ